MLIKCLVWDGTKMDLYSLSAQVQFSIPSGDVET